jgi:DNA-binding response OmpR family regulator
LSCTDLIFLPGELLRAQERIKELEQRLEASDKARRDAETKIEAAEARAATADDLRVRLNHAETTLSEKEEQISQRESAVLARLETQSNRFLCNCSFLVPISFFLYYQHNCIAIPLTSL